MLTDAQRKELETWGSATVRAHLSSFPGTGAGAAIPGFKSGEMTRSDITDWLIQRTKIEQWQQSAILVSAIVAGLASIAAVVVGILSIVLQK